MTDSGTFVKTRICIIGTGAMASLFAGRLSRVAEVSMIGSWQTQINALNQGALFEESNGDTWAFAVDAFTRVPEDYVADLVLILTKGYRNEQAADFAAYCLTYDSYPGIVLTLQNGLGNDLHLKEKISAERILVGVTTQAANLIRPGHVKDNGAGPVSLPLLKGKEQEVELISQIFAEAGFKVKISAGTEVLLWRKLLVNASINPLTAIFNARNGEIASNPDYRYLMLRLGGEVLSVAAAYGLDLGIEDLESYLVNICTSTANNQSSMLRDVLRKGNTENETINGAVIRKAAVLNIGVGINRLVYNLVKDIESGKREPGEPPDLSKL